MCWSCLQASHLDLPTSTQRVGEAIRYLSDERALLAYLDPAIDTPEFSWTGFAGNQRMPVIVSYNLLSTAELPPNDGAYGSDGYFAFNATQSANFRAALQEFSRVSGVVFVETDGPAMINAFGSVGAAAGGWANLANSGLFYTGEGNLVINDSSNFAKGGQGFHTILHELGHALGLKHPFEGDNRLVAGMDNTSTTVMSYNYTELRQTLGSLDVSALQALYGTAINTSGWSMTFQNGDFVASGSGRADIMTGIGLDNRISGLGGNDQLRGRQGHDTLLGGDGHDTLEGGNGADRLDGGAGNDSLVGARSSEVVYGDALPSRDDTLIGGSGNDRLIAGVRQGTLTGGDGNDFLRAVGGGYWDGADRLYGGGGDDTLMGSHASDTLSGESGHDRIITGPALRADGGTGNDTLTGGNWANQLYGGDGLDSLIGAGGADRLFGGLGFDTLLGGDGNDRLDGGLGGARLTGGAGIDTFVFTLSSGAEVTRVTDFATASDRLLVNIGANSLDDITFASRNGGLDTLATVQVQGSAQTALILFQGVAMASLSDSMFDIL